MVVHARHGVALPGHRYRLVHGHHGRSVIVSRGDRGLHRRRSGCRRAMRAQCGHGLQRHGHAQQPQHEKFAPAIHAAQSSTARAALANRREILACLSVRASVLEQMKRLEVCAPSRERDEIDNAPHGDQHEEGGRDFDGVAREKRDERQPDHQGQHRPV